MADSAAKSAWDKANTIQVAIKVNRNQDPELYKILMESESKSATARDLMRAAIK